jgi:uncharacterized protein (TIGR04255 family)
MLVAIATGSFSKSELEEVFPANPIREVDFEIRFAPRLRVQAEMWRFQEDLMSEYPEVGLESALLPNGATLNVTVFQNQVKARVIKVSPQNMALAFSAYRNFEEFKEEVQKRSSSFSGIFDVTSLTRIGLRYVNEIPLPTQQSESMTQWVKPLVEFDRFPLDCLQQFALQMTAKQDDHMILVRTAMLAGPIRTYILDIDAYTETEKPTTEIGALLDRFHDSVQRVFLDHVTEEYKKVMRGEK